MGIDSARIISLYDDGTAAVYHDSSIAQKFSSKNNNPNAFKVKHLVDLVRMLGEL